MIGLILSSFNFYDKFHKNVNSKKSNKYERIIDPLCHAEIFQDYLRVNSFCYHPLPHPVQPHLCACLWMQVYRCLNYARNATLHRGWDEICMCSDFFNKKIMNIVQPTGGIDISTALNCCHWLFATYNLCIGNSYVRNIILNLSSITSDTVVSGSEYVHIWMLSFTI